VAAPAQWCQGDGAKIHDQLGTNQIASDRFFFGRFAETVLKAQSAASWLVGSFSFAISFSSSPRMASKWTYKLKCTPAQRKTSQSQAQGWSNQQQGDNGIAEDGPGHRARA
jgi:hypothetical protein